MRQVCAHLDALPSPQMRTGIELAIDTGRRPEAATVMLRLAVRARKDLLTHRVGLANQLRAHLRFFHPGPVGLFADLDAVTSLRLLGRFACQDDADWLTLSSASPSHRRR